MIFLHFMTVLNLKYPKRKRRRAGEEVEDGEVVQEATRIQPLKIKKRPMKIRMKQTTMM
jgi:hypothetical protein